MIVKQQSRAAPGISLIPPPAIPLAAMFFALITPSILSLLLFETRLVLPALSLISLAIAGLVALLACATASTPDRAHITLWDLSGLYALLGFAAGMLSEPEYLIELWSLPKGAHGAAP